MCIQILMQFIRKYAVLTIINTLPQSLRSIFNLVLDRLGAIELVLIKLVKYIFIFKFQNSFFFNLIFKLHHFAISNIYSNFQYPI